MNCEAAANLICAELDGELESNDRTTLSAHLAQCAMCRTTKEAICLQDGEIRRAFGPRREAAAVVADRVIEEIVVRQGSRGRLIRWLPLTAAAAAGFLLAAIVLPLEATKKPLVNRLPGAPAPPVARLALSTGTIEISAVGEGSWSPLTTGAEVVAGSCVRTGPGVVCEFRMPDGSEIRMNADTELLLSGGRNVHLTRGEVWSTVASSDELFRVHAMDVTVTALGTRFDVARKRDTVVLLVADGETRVNAGLAERVVGRGERLTITGGTLGQTQAAHDLVQATRWVHELLLKKGRDHPELADRIDLLLAQIGKTKMSFLAEDEIRAMGDHCVPPLMRFVAATCNEPEAPQRIRAARIVSEVAQPWRIPDLIEMLKDPAGDVQAYADAALVRLTGRSRGVTDASCSNRHQEWSHWWEQNKQRYPEP
ncbi:MAG: FecR family protein [Planctomycetota bacterium]|nr:FecR family protein [Planctomycetota bacterium]